MKKDIEALLDTYNIGSYDEQSIDDVAKLMSKIIECQAQSEYFEILDTYIKHKKSINMNITQVSKKADIPVLTIRRFENLQHFPNIITLIKILHSVGLKLSVTSIEK